MGLKTRGLLSGFASLVLLLGLGRCGAGGQAGELAPQSRVMELTLREGILLAIHNNLELAIEQVNPLVRDKELTGKQGKYDPTVSVEVGGESSRRQVVSELMDSESSDIAWGGSVSKLLPTGTVIGVRMGSGRASTDNLFVDPSRTNRAELTLELLHPLLRGSGTDLNNAEIVIAANDKRMAGHQLQSSAMNVVADVQSRYWDLAFTAEHLAVERISLEQARDLLAANRERVALGAMARNEIIQTEATVAEREERIVTARAAVEEAEDRLKAITRLAKDEASWQLRIVPTDRPVLRPKTVDLDESLRAAFQNRPDWAEASLAIENARIGVDVARDGVRPRLDFTGSAGLNGLDHNYGNAVDGLFSGSFYAWQAGLALEFPLGNRAAKSEFEKSRLLHRQSVLLMERLRQRIIVQVRRAARHVETNLERVKAAELTRKLQETKLSAEMELLRVGKATSHDVLEYQRDLAIARSGYLKALVDYNRSLVELQRVTGTIFEQNDVRIQ